MDNAAILNGLNEDQKKPVLDYMGSCFVVAGPGSGKTKVIISRTAYMLNQGINPEEIILFTFTNKAAKEIKERVMSFIGEKAYKLTVGTYHSVCVRLLKKYADYLGYTRFFTIYDTEDCKSILKKLCKLSGVEHMQALEYISHKKTNGISPADAIQASSGYEDRLAAVYRDYQMHLKNNNAMDFDDLIMKTIFLLETYPEVKKEVNNHYRYIISDEHHDSSPSNLRLIELLAGENQNVCMILDPDQSIYGFRGANLEAVLNVNKVFKNLKTYVLHQNYRSTQTIVNASCSLISHNTVSIKKDLFSANDIGDKIFYFEEDSPEEEALRCVKLIKTLTNNAFGLKYSDIAILYRMSFMSRTLEEAFLRNGIPYSIVGGIPFCNRKEIKDLLSYLKLLYNPYDFEAFQRCINVPKRGIGAVAINKIKTYKADHNNKNYIEVLKEMTIKGKTKKEIDSFIGIIDHLQKMLEEMANPTDILKQLIEQISYQEYLYATENKKEDADDRFANVQELINISLHFETLQDFLDDISLNVNEIEEDDSIDKINLLTEHASKGLEFPAVIIIESSEGYSPHYKAESQSAVEEERRLYYVAMTRAKQYLFLTRSKKVYQNGHCKYPPESRFIKEIDKKYVKKY